MKGWQAHSPKVRGPKLALTGEAVSKGSWMVVVHRSVFYSQKKITPVGCKSAGLYKSV